MMPVNPFDRQDPGRPQQDAGAEDSGGDDTLFDRPSKSQRKRDSDAMQQLGAELTRLAPDELARIPLPEDILDAVNDYKKMKSFGALRRQLQLIGKLMRRLEYAPVREAIDRATGQSKAATAAMHRAERLREAMIADDGAVTRFVDEHASDPDLDVQRLRQLVRAARKEAAQGKPPKSARELYRLIHALVFRPIDLQEQAPQDDGGDGGDGP